jgi:hypothetical protein
MAMRMIDWFVGLFRQAREVNTVYGGAYRTAATVPIEPVEKKPMKPFKVRHPKLYAPAMALLGFGITVATIGVVGLLLYTPYPIGRLLGVCNTLGDSYPFCHNESDQITARWLAGLLVLCIPIVLYLFAKLMTHFGKRATESYGEWQYNRKHKNSH